jgi:hypothetical protein
MLLLPTVARLSMGSRLVLLVALLTSVPVTQVSSVS